MKNLILVITMISLFSACGSRSSDFSTVVDEEVTNPLPPCPDSPNCVRITDRLPLSADESWSATLRVFEKMKPYKIELSPDEYRIDATFMVVFFQDDMAVQLTEADTSSTFMHIRSASRVGHSDLGVNRRRVQEFREMVDQEISQ